MILLRKLLQEGSLVNILPSGIKIDQKDGIGSTSYNQDINYFGFEREMVPDEFLRLSLPLESYSRPIEKYVDAIKSKGMASPFFMVRWLPNIKYWQITGHEGRHRMTAVKNFFGRDVKIPVHIFPTGGLRRRDLTPEMINAPLIKEKS